MDITIRLNSRQAEVLRYVLDNTSEEWDDTHEGSILDIADDPAVTSLEELLETAGSLNELNVLVREIREKLVPHEHAGANTA